MAFLLVLVVLLAAEWLCGRVNGCSLISGGGKENLSSPSNHTLHFLSLLPYPNPAHPPQPSWDEGPSVFIAEQLAVEHINNRTDLLPGYTVELIQGDGGCDLSNRALVSFVKYVICDKRNVVGIIGPGCSSSARVIGSLTRPKRAALISFHLGASSILHNQTLYPYSFGLRGTTAESLNALIILINKANWTQVNTLYEESRLFYLTYQIRLEEALKKGSVHSIAFSSAIYDDYIPFDDLERSVVRVILLLAGPEMVERTLCLAHYRGLVYPRYQWVAAYEQAFRSIRFRYQGKRYECSEDDIWAAAQGNVIFSVNVAPENTSEVTETGLSYDQFAALYRSRVALYNIEQNMTITPSFWAPMFYDAVWFLALALNNSNISLSAYDYKEQSNAEIIKEQVEFLNFSGVSGRVQFDNQINVLQHSVDIFVVTENKSFNLVGQYHDGELEITNPAVFIAALHIPDVDGDKYNLQFLPFTLVFMVLTILSLLLLIATHIFSIVYRKFPSVKASSLQLTHLAFIGCYLLLLSVIFFIINQHIPQSSFSCILEQVVLMLGSLGGALIASVLLARTWRLYRILVHFRNPGRFLSDRYLFLFVLLMAGINLIISGLFFLLDPVKTEMRSNGEKVCVAEDISVWTLSSTGYNLLLMIPMVWYAMKCTCVPVPKKDFNTSRVLILCLCTSVTQLVGVPSVLLFMLQGTGTGIAKFVCYCVVLHMLVFFFQALLFIPPTWPLLRQKYLPKYFHT